MNHKSISEWAISRFNSDQKTIGYSSYTVEHLINNFTQVHYYGIASLSNFINSSQLAISIKCVNPEYLANKFKFDPINVGYQQCRSSFDQDSCDSIMRELDQIISIANSLKSQVKDLSELQGLPKNAN